MLNRRELLSIGLGGIVAAPAMAGSLLVDSKVLSTGFEQLDAVLDGGFRTGEIATFFGRGHFGNSYKNFANYLKFKYPSDVDVIDLDCIFNYIFPFSPSGEEKANEYLETLLKNKDRLIVVIKPGAWNDLEVGEQFEKNRFLKNYDFTSLSSVVCVCENIKRTDDQLWTVNPQVLPCNMGIIKNKYGDSNIRRQIAIPLI